MLPLCCRDTNSAGKNPEDNDNQTDKPGLLPFHSSPSSEDQVDCPMVSAHKSPLKKYAEESS